VTALLIIACAVVAATIGGLIGLWVGERGGGDYNFLPLFTGPFGALIGGFVGLVAGSFIFT
jgi:hypothetical protein